MFIGRDDTQYKGYSFCEEEDIRTGFTRLRCKNRKLVTGGTCKVCIVVMNSAIEMFAVNSEAHECTGSKAKKRGRGSNEEDKENANPYADH